VVVSLGRKKAAAGSCSRLCLGSTFSLEPPSTPRTPAALGVTRQAISAWSLGISLPDIEKFGLIADFFGVSTEFLLGRTDVSKPDATKQALAEYLCLSEAAIDEIHRLQSIHLEQNIENDFKLTVKEPEPLTEVFSEWLTTVDLSEMMSHLWRASKAAYEAQDSAYRPEDYQPDEDEKEALAALRGRGYVALGLEEQMSFFCRSAGKVFEQSVDAVVAAAIAQADADNATDET